MQRESRLGRGLEHGPTHAGRVPVACGPLTACDLWCPFLMVAIPSKAPPHRSLQKARAFIIQEVALPSPLSLPCPPVSICLGFPLINIQTSFLHAFSRLKSSETENGRMSKPPVRFGDSSSSSAFQLGSSDTARAALPLSRLRDAEWGGHPSKCDEMPRRFLQ